MEDRETARMRKYGESKMARIMMATVPHIISGLGLRKFQADRFLLTRVYSSSLLGLMNHVKSAHHTVDHFGSVKYAELVDLTEVNGNSKWSCTYCCCLVPKIHFFLNATQLAEVTTVRITIWYFCGTVYFHCNEISLQLRQ